MEDSDNITKMVIEALKLHYNQKNIKSRERFFKEKILTYGVSVIEIRKIIRKTYPKLTDNGIICIFKDLVSSKIFDEKIAGIILLGYALEKKKELFFDFYLIEEALEKHIDNWALCDTISTDVIAKLLDLNPEYINKILPWATSKNIWKRRALIVSVIKSKKLSNREKLFQEILNLYRGEKDPIVTKSLKWLNKEMKE